MKEEELGEGKEVVLQRSSHLPEGAPSFERVQASQIWYILSRNASGYIVESADGEMGRITKGKGGTSRAQNLRRQRGRLIHPDPTKRTQNEAKGCRHSRVVVFPVLSSQFGQMYSTEGKGKKSQMGK